MKPKYQSVASAATLQSLRMNRKWSCRLHKCIERVGFILHRVLSGNTDGHDLWPLLQQASTWQSQYDGLTVWELLCRPYSYSDNAVHQENKKSSNVLEKQECGAR